MNDNVVVAISTVGRFIADYSLLAIILLIIVLTQKELLRAYGGARLRTWRRFLDLASWPLIVAFGLVVVQRLLVYLRWNS